MVQRTLLLGLVVMIAVSGCAGIGGSGKTVSATDNQFTPNTLSVKQNEEVTWKNDGNARHSVTIHKAGDALTTTKMDRDITSGTSTSYKFEETGTYHVYCKYHSAGSTGNFGTGMVMTVTVA